MTDFHELVEAARSCRRFVTSSPLGMKDLEMLADCARLSPSGRNAQELRFCLVSDPRACAAVYPLLTWAAALKDWGGPIPEERPTGYIVILAPVKVSATQGIDIGIAMQTIQLAATSRGWGCCPIATFNKEKLVAALSLPEGYTPALVLALGVAKEIRHAVTVRAGESLNYYRDEQAVHYVPKIALEDLVLRR